MKRILLPILALLVCLILLSLPALAQAPPGNPYSCADAEWIEPGWTCTEHFGYAFPGWGSYSWNTVDFDKKGGLWRGTRAEIVPVEYCGGEPLQGYHLYRLGEGYSYENQAPLKTIMRFRDKCVGDGITAQMFAGNVRVIEGGSVIIRIVPRIAATGFNATWVIRLSPVPELPASDHSVSPDLSLGNAGGEGEAHAPRTTVRGHE